jgi:DNA-binding NtrC family response regulator
MTATADAPAPADSVAGMRVFLVEDDPTILFALEAIVESYGCVVVGTAMRVADGFAFIAANVFDAAVMDVRLADGDSDALVAALVARGTPLIVTSGAGVARHTDASDGVVFLQKPYTDRALHKALLDIRRKIDGN